MNRKSRRAEAARHSRAPQQRSRPARLLHLHSSFDRGGKELRCVQLINQFGPGVEHSVVSGEPAAMAAADLILPDIPVLYPLDFPSLKGRPWLGRLKRLAQAMQGYDLVLTYNWGAMDAVLAHTLFGQLMALPPLVHHEDGFNEDETQRLKKRRNWYRRIALARSDALVVPSQRLETIALEEWQQPRVRVHRIANGIATADYAAAPEADAVPGLAKPADKRWIGTLAGLRKIKNLPRLLRAVEQLPCEWELVVLGEGPERAALVELARELGIGERVHLPGFVAEPSRAAGLFDIFALSSDSEQFPISVVEAMAAGLPVAATDVGDIRQMVAADNGGFLTPVGDDAAFAVALARLAGDEKLRDALGKANRARARELYDEKRMITRYRALYGALIGDGGLG